MSMSVAMPSEFTQRENLEIFVRQKLAIPKKVVVEFMLVLCIAGEQDQIINSFPVPAANDRDDAWPKELAESAMREARADVATSKTGNKYALVAMIKGGEHLGRHPFLLNPPVQAGLGMGGGESEPPTAPGLLSAGMRWGDTALRLAFGNMQQQLMHSQTDLERSQTRCRELESRVNEQFDRIQALQDKNWERDLAMQREKRSDDRVERLMLNFERFILPAVAQKFGVPMTASATVEKPSDLEADPIATFMYLYGSLSEEQKEKIVEVLNEEQRTTFIAAVSGMWKYVQAKKEKAA